MYLLTRITSLNALFLYNYTYPRAPCTHPINPQMQGLCHSLLPMWPLHHPGIFQDQHVVLNKQLGFWMYTIYFVSMSIYVQLTSHQLVYTSSDTCWFLVHVMIVTHMHGACKPKIKVSWGIWCLIFHADSCNDCVHNLHAWPKCTNVSSDFFAFWASMWVSVINFIFLQCDEV